MGKSQRDKGARRERELVHELQSQLIPAKRVPLSGAAIGFKHDVIATYKGEKRIEVKSRRDDYDRIYALFDQFNKNKVFAFSAPKYDHACVYVTADFKDAIDNAFIFDTIGNFNISKRFDRTIRKLVNMKKLLEGADLLAIKADRKPWLYVVYR